ncbi:MFS transporter [Sphingomonas oligophenolica]
MKLKIGIIAALWVLNLVNYLDRVAMSFAGPFIMKTLHMTPAEFGIVLSSFSVGYLLAQIPGGLLGDRFGARALLVVGPIFWAIFTGATGLVATIAGFVVVRFLFGLSEGVATPSLYKIVGENFEVKERSRVLAICSTALPLAPVFAGALVGKLIIAFGWKAMFMILAGPALVVALACYLLLPTQTRKGDASVIGLPAAPSFTGVLGRRSLWLISLASLSWNLTYWGYLGWMPSYLALARHIDLKAVGALAALPYVFAFVGMLIIGWLGSGPLHRFCERIVITCFLGGGLFLYLAYAANSLEMSLVGLSGAAFFLFGGSGPIGKILLDLAPPSARAAYIGVYSTVGQVGAVIAPMAVGFMVTETGTFASGFTLMELALVGAAVLLVAATVAARRELARDALAPVRAS